METGDLDLAGRFFTSEGAAHTRVLTGVTLDAPGDCAPYDSKR